MYSFIFSKRSGGFLFHILVFLYSCCGTHAHVCVYMVYQEKSIVRFIEIYSQKTSLEECSQIYISSFDWCSSSN